uniref:Uncharacterized protein n=1 Tax=Rhizophora mucronata TaxID=61149 RepID=A0A2P2J3L0_RHIMU
MKLPATQSYANYIKFHLSSLQSSYRQTYKRGNYR